MPAPAQTYASSAAPSEGAAPAGLYARSACLLHARVRRLPAAQAAVQSRPPWRVRWECRTSRWRTPRGSRTARAHRRIHMLPPVAVRCLAQATVPRQGRRVWREVVVRQGRSPATRWPFRQLTPKTRLRLVPPKQPATQWHKQAATAEATTRRQPAGPLGGPLGGSVSELQKRDAPYRAPYCSDLCAVRLTTCASAAGD